MPSWINAVFAAIIVVRLGGTIARMHGRAAPLAALAVLGLFLGALGWLALPLYGAWEAYTDTLLIGSLALYLVADRSCLVCVAIPPWPRLRFAGLAAAVLVATLWVGHVHAQAPGDAPARPSAQECYVFADLAIVARALAEESVAREPAGRALRKIYTLTRPGWALAGRIVDAAYLATERSNPIQFAGRLYAACRYGEIDRVLGVAS